MSNIKFLSANKDLRAFATILRDHADRLDKGEIEACALVTVGKTIYAGHLISDDIQTLDIPFALIANVECMGLQIKYEVIANLQQKSIDDNIKPSEEDK